MLRFVEKQRLMYVYVFKVECQKTRTIVLFYICTYLMREVSTKMLFELMSF